MPGEMNPGPLPVSNILKNAAGKPGCKLFRREMPMTRSFLGMTVGRTQMGGNEVVCILRRPAR